MAFNINEFRSQMQGDGARPNLFEVTLPFPAFSLPGNAQTKLSFLCKTAQLPGSSLGTIPIKYFGRELKFAGNRSFQDWSITIINDEDFLIRNAFERWMNEMNKLENATGATNPSSYMADAYVHQLGRGAGTRSSTNNSSLVNGSAITPLRTYKFYSIFPTNVSAIDLSYDSENTIEEYSVEFQVLYWTAGETSDATGVTIR